MFKFPKTELPALLAAIAAKQSLFLPVKAGGRTDFALWTEGKGADLTTLKTVRSPKDLFFPQSETLYTVTGDLKNMAVHPGKLQDEDFVAFGVKACDVRGIQVLDRVFLSEPVDSFYAARRAHGTLVALACSEPEETCFCGVFDIDCAEPEGDVVLWQTENEFFWKPVTEKGEKLTALVAGHLQPAEEADAEAEKAKIHAVAEKLPCADLSLENWGAGKTEMLFESPLWENLYTPCLACGTCTFVCPTCQCYDIKDYDTGHGVQRYRCWDSCMYSDFTMMAHGNNRTSQMQRFRQRFMHKLVYFPENNDGVFSCVGCGRCVEKCPSGLHIVKVLRAFEKEVKRHA